VRFVVDKVCCDRDFFEYFRFLLSASFHKCSELTYIFWLHLSEGNDGVVLRSLKRSNAFPNIRENRPEKYYHIFFHPWSFRMKGYSVTSDTSQRRLKASIRTTNTIRSLCGLRYWRCSVRILAVWQKRTACSFVEEETFQDNLKYLLTEKKLISRLKLVKTRRLSNYTLTLALEQ